MRKDDFVYKELKTQENRLKYIEAALSGRVECDFYPRRVFIEPTNYCNCKCVHCPGSSFMTRKRGYMDFNLYMKIIDELAPFWSFVTINLYQHGEPLLHKRIYDMIDFAQGKNLFVKMNTNLGSLKKGDIPRLLKLNYLEIAIDSASKHTYRKIKGRDKFEKVLDNILDFLEAWGELATPATYACDVSFLSQHLNVHEAEIFEDMFSRLPIGHVNVFPLHNFTGAISEGALNMPNRKSMSRADWPRCNTPWDIMGINWDGTAVACVYDYDSRYQVGDVKKMSVMDCWNSAEMQRFRKGLLDRDYSEIEKRGSLCSECSILWLEDYHIPTDFYKEVNRMEKYLSRAIRRVADQKERYDILMEKWKYLKLNREEWKKELLEKGRELIAKEGANE